MYNKIIIKKDGEIMKLTTTPVRGTVDYLPNEMEVKSYAAN